jgi:hypothetical protein
LIRVGACPGDNGAVGGFGPGGVRAVGTPGVALSRTVS